MLCPLDRRLLMGDPVPHQGLWNTIVRIVNTFPAEECKNYFVHAGYVLN